jgi:CBS domain-containing protein
MQSPGLLETGSPALSVRDHRPCIGITRAATIGGGGIEVSWTVGDVMTKEVVTVEVETDFKSCVDLLRVHGISAMPVVEGDFVLGIVSEFDLLLKEESRDPVTHLKRGQVSQANGRLAGDVMTHPALCIGPGASITDAARLMHKRAVKRLPVVDEHGRLVGIVSRHDLLKAFLRSDESIRREVAEDLLAKALFIDNGAVGVDVQDGVMTLTGELETKSLADLVTRLASSVDGVVGVDSRIQFRLDDTGRNVEVHG